MTLTQDSYHKSIYQILPFFSYSHLSPKLQGISKPFQDLAHKVANTAPESYESAIALRKLLEAKDAAVRAALSTIDPNKKN